MGGHQLDNWASGLTQCLIKGPRKYQLLLCICSHFTPLTSHLLWPQSPCLLSSHPRSEDLLQAVGESHHSESAHLNQPQREGKVSKLSVWLRKHLVIWALFCRTGLLITSCSRILQVAIYCWGDFCTQASQKERRCQELPEGHPVEDPRQLPHQGVLPGKDRHGFRAASSLASWGPCLPWEFKKQQDSA